MNPNSLLRAGKILALMCPLVLFGCDGDGNDNPPPPPTSSIGPADQGPAFPQRTTGDAANGMTVFRSETFGNERFFTDAMRLPQGIVAKGITPVQALGIGLNVNSDALAPLGQPTLDAIVAELATDLSQANAPILNDPATTIALLNLNAVIGVVAKDTNLNGVIDVENGDKVGASCALCHNRTNGSVANIPGAGSIGQEMDGLATHNLDFGSLIALADNTLAYYPIAQLRFANGTTLGRAPLADALDENSTEVQADAYFNNDRFYPRGMFDDTFDGNGDPMHNMPLFEQDLAAPYGSEGLILAHDNFANLVYTGLLDPTSLVTPTGRAFLNMVGGAAGAEIADDYAAVLARTGVAGPFPLVTATTVAANVAGTEAAPLGFRVDDQKLVDMNAYVFSLQAPAGVVGSAPADTESVARGAALFSSIAVGCTSCHNLSQARLVPTFIVPMGSIFPGDTATFVAARPPLPDIVDTPGNVDTNPVNLFDDKMAVINATIRGDIRGTALPLLLDLAAKPVFLHDNSVPDLDTLLNASRGPLAPHPFYLTDLAQRADMVAFLTSLDTTP